MNRKFVVLPLLGLAGTCVAASYDAKDYRDRCVAQETVAGEAPSLLPQGTQRGQSRSGRLSEPNGDEPNGDSPGLAVCRT